ncbi:M50 family metallopeptidase [Jonesia quinghaiensis]|uniref:M50 family metallopeptidase n=1 Tax=Jonesia quinghaiensis TaxID=262806 RepID=UPI0004046CAD|nr:site-2 protease family protein [Jonesia quinghaiensis]
MDFLWGVLTVVVGLLASIALHEVGHMVPAKKFGVRVPQYMVGFGPTLWSTHRGETEYGIKAIPLGGYVRLVGMYPPENTDRKRRMWFRELITGAREASLEEIRPGEENRAFYKLSTPKKLIVMAGGPLMNLVIAAFLLTVIVVAFGRSEPTTQIAEVSQCVVSAQESRTECESTDPITPAAQAGLLPGDVITGFADQEVSSWDDLSDRIARYGGQEVSVTYLRDGAESETTLVPLITPRPVLDRYDIPQFDDSGELVTEQRGFLGVAPTFEQNHQPFVVVPELMGQGITGTLGIIVRLPERMVDVWNAAFGGQERDVNSVIGVVGVGRVAGEITSAPEFSSNLAAQTQQLLSLLASLNIALFAFNMIPLLPLDGGHVAGALYEGGRRQWARLRHRPDPGHADTAQMLPVAYVVFVLLAGMGILLIYADIVNPVRLIQ